MSEIKPLTEIAADRLIDYVIKNKIPVGGKLPNEFELATILGCGRSTVREAVKILASRNVLEVKQGSGTFVAREKIGVCTDPLGFTFIEDKQKLILDLIEVRITLEPRIAALAATNATEEEILEMARLCQEVEDQINSGIDHVQSDIAFHTKIAESSKNLVMPNLMPIIQGAIVLFVDTTNRKLKQETIETHRMMLNAIKNRDSIGASDATYLHILYNRKSILENK